MGAGVTEICNLALSAIGTRSSISSISEDSNEARECNLHFNSTRKFLLRAAHWGFARAYAKLSVVLARYGTPEFSPPGYTPPGGWDPNLEPPPPWLYAYAPPSNMLAMRYILPKTPSEGTIQPPLFGSTTTVSYPDEWVGPAVKYELFTKQMGGIGTFSHPLFILCNQRQAIACYTIDVADPTSFEDSFTQAFIHGFAANMTKALTGDLKLYDALIKVANSIILEARVKSANETLSTNDVMPDWYRTRGLGPAVGTGPHMAEYGPLFGGVM